MDLSSGFAKVGNFFKDKVLAHLEIFGFKNDFVHVGDMRLGVLVNIFMVNASQQSVVVHEDTILLDILPTGHFVNSTGDGYKFHRYSQREIG